MKKVKKQISNIKKYILNIKDKYPILIYYIIFNFINSILFRLLTTNNFSIRPLFFDLSFVLLLGSLSFFVKSKKKNVYYISTSFLMMVICIVNSMYYNYYSSFVSISLLATSMFLKDFGDVVVEFAINLKDWIYILPFIGMIWVIKKNKKKEINELGNFRNFIILVVLFLGIGSVLPPYNSYSRFIKLWNRVAVVNSFGIYTYQVDDLVQSLKPTFNNMFGYDSALKDVKDYFNNNKSEVSRNSYSGIFEGKNVIAIHAESLQNFVIGLEINGQEITPNINKLVKKSLYFDNFYAQVGVGTSSDSEFTYATSLLPANNGTVFVNYYNNNFNTIQNLLKDKDYYVFSMHGNVGDFWNRNAMHNNMGYDNFYSKDSFIIDEEYGLGLSDKSFFRQVISIIKDIKQDIDKPFYGTLITLTNHTPWDSADELSELDLSMSVNINGEIVKRDYLEGKTLGNYLKIVNYMDSAIGQFLSDIENEGLLDNTVIVIYGDHDARIGKKNYDYMFNYNPYTDSLYTEEDSEYVEFNDYDYELNRSVPLIIWSKDLEESKTISTPMGMIDVLPTLGNMLNIYNEYSLGTDIMGITDSENIVVFKDGSYLTNKIYYSAKNNEAYMLSNGVITDDYIKNNIEYANEILDISDKIITYNLIKDLN